jgi:hypothetical protein
MIKSILRYRIESEAIRRGVPLDYLKDILQTSLPAFLQYTKFLGPAEYRKKLPLPVYHMARLWVTKQEGVISCLEVECLKARSSGFSDDWISGVLTGDVEKAQHELRAPFAFVLLLLSREESSDLDNAREEFLACYGREALVELSFVIASCRVFPIIKKVLGYK